MQKGIHNFSRQDMLVYGRPAAQVVQEFAERQEKSRVFIVTNQSLGDSALVRGHVEALGSRFAGLYQECAAHSPRKSVLDGSAAARAADADAIVAIGGGSVIDAAKVMLGCLWCGIQTNEELDALRDGRYDQALRGAHALRMVAVPTTLSAAEFTPLAGITDTERGTKDLFLHPLYVPAIVVLDPQATALTPDWLFGSTGIRSIDHCIETLLSSEPSPFATALARDGLGLLCRSLRAFHETPSDIESRLDCQLGTWLAISGPVAGVPLGASHAIGRVLGGAFGVPHGHTSCVLLPAVLRWNAKADLAAAARQQQVTDAMGSPPGTSAADAVAQLVRALGQPGSLRDLGIGKDKFSVLIDKSMVMLRHPTTSGNQRPVRSEQDVLEILELAY